MRHQTYINTAIRKLVLATASVSMVITGVAFAADVLEGPEPGCWSREYSADHILAHPDQIVERMALMVLDDQSETTRIANLSIWTTGQGHVARSGHMLTRFDQTLICWEDSGATGCSVECDGGAMKIVGVPDGGLKLTTDYLMVGDTETCGGAVDLAEIPGQPVSYIVERADSSVCEAAFGG